MTQERPGSSLQYRFAGDDIRDLAVELLGRTGRPSDAKDVAAVALDQP